MVEYKRGFLKSSSIVIYTLPFIALVYISFRHIDALKFWLWGKTEIIVAIMVFAFCIGPFVYSLFQQLYFIEITETDLVLRNGLMYTMKKVIPIDGTHELLIVYNRASGIHFMKYRKKGKKRWGWYYGIDLVDPKDLKEIVSILESKGVTVITKDLEDL